jgi:hypothetical protein
MSFGLIGQEHDQDHSEHEHHMHDHSHHLGLALGPVYVPDEEEFAPGAHLHYAYLFDIGKEQFGIGLGLEGIFDEHGHYSTSLNLSYLPIHQWTITMAPGIQFGEDERQFTTHFETSYEFIWDRLHLGPVFEYAYAADDAHYMLGLHLGLGL